jgi:hypothetical protein
MIPSFQGDYAHAAELNYNTIKNEAFCRDQSLKNIVCLTLLQADIKLNLFENSFNIFGFFQFSQYL